MERMLALFDQCRTARFDPHLLDISEESVPERYRDALWRLLRAGAEQSILDGMDVEEDVIAALKWQVRKTAQVLEQKYQIIAGLKRPLGRPAGQAPGTA